MSSLLTMLDDLVVKIKALGRDAESEEMQLMEELKDRVHVLEIRLVDMATGRVDTPDAAVQDLEPSGPAVVDNSAQQSRHA